MAIVVIGGHTRNIGKTSVMCSLICAMPERRWTAIKITQFGHGVCSADGRPCGCENVDHAVAISVEHNAMSGTDTSRYLAAGADRSVWIRTRQGQLAEAMPCIRKEIAATGNVIIESNSVLRFIRPDFFASVLDPNVADFKASALRYLDRADALLLSGDFSDCTAWDKVSPGLLRNIRSFRIVLPTFSSVDFEAYVALRLDLLSGKRLGEHVSASMA